MRRVGSVSDNANSERRVLPGRCNGEGAFAPATNLNCYHNDMHRRKSVETALNTVRYWKISNLKKVSKFSEICKAARRH